MPDPSKYLAPGQGPTWTILGGDTVTIKLTGAETGGAFAVLETTTPPNMGPPPHVHHREEEQFYVLEGNFVFHIGDRRIMAGQGSFVVAPKDVPHRFVNVGTTVGRILVILRPAGLENFFAEFAKVPTNAPPDMAMLKAIGDRFGLEFLM